MKAYEKGEAEMDEQASRHHRCINFILSLTTAAVQNPNSSHPGMPMGAATMAYLLWARHFKHYPGVPHLINRYRFVLSPDHGSRLLCMLLHLTGYDLLPLATSVLLAMGSRIAYHFAQTTGVSPKIKQKSGKWVNTNLTGD